MPPRRTLLAAILLGLTAWAPVLIASEFLAFHLFDMPEEMMEAMRELFPVPQSPLDWLLLFLVVAITPAICEEFIFRGFIFRGLRRHLGPASTVLVTAILFGLFHMSLYRIVGTTLLGIVLGLVVLRTRSIWPAIIIHALNNALALVLLPHEEHIAEHGLPVLPLAAATLVFATTLTLFLRATRPDPPSPEPVDPPPI